MSQIPNPTSISHVFKKCLENKKENEKVEQI
jgi:hypothetical protein